MKGITNIRRHISIVLGTGAAVMALGVTGGAAAAPSTASEAAASDQLIVGFSDGVSPSRERRVIDGANANRVAELASIDAAAVRAPASEGLSEIAARLQRSPAVDYVEPDYLLSGQTVPNDPLFGELWALRNTGQDGGVPDADIDAPKAWDLTTGGDPVVAVIDTGLDVTHPDLDANLWQNPGEVPGNGVDDDGNGVVDDVHGASFLTKGPGKGAVTDGLGHGTHVSGTIAAEGDNGTGVAGVSWSARLMAVRFLDDEGYGYTSDAVQAVDYARKEGARVINASWGGSGDSKALHDAVKRARKAQILFVAAAGNEEANTDKYPSYPASYGLRNVISVAASNRNDAITQWSNYGAESVDLAAPGKAILSTVPGGGYERHSGTSMATPHVTGAAALMLARDPNLTIGQLRAKLLQSVDPIPSMKGRIATGGRLNVADALALVSP